MNKNFEIINGIASLNKLIETYLAVKEDVDDIEILQKESINVAELLCITNNSLTEAISINNGLRDDSIEVGKLKISCKDVEFLHETLSRYIGNIFDNEEISIPIEINHNENIVMGIEVDDVIEKASDIAQYTAMTLIKNNKNIKFKCVDMVNDGGFFTILNNLVSKFPAKSGGKVYKTQNELDELLKELQQQASENMSKLGMTYNTLEEYNHHNDIKLQKYINVIFLEDSNFYLDSINNLKKLVSNSRKNGMSFIIVGSKNMIEQFADESDYYIVAKKIDLFIGNKEPLLFNIDEKINLGDIEYDSLLNELEQSDIVDTLYENHQELFPDYLKMDSTKALRIPFAFDKNQMIKYFEIGGEAPPHALISGSTGSGKSVALHTLIMQIIKNYHPDDVEIWAIDYKAVEFDWYIQHRSPHFRVVGHDTSEEFSLSLLDLLYKEYEDRKEKFIKEGVKNLKEYREKKGNHSMTRIVVFIDEFQIMTQAVQNYNGNRDYRTVLENLLKLTRAMGISFVLCSQTIASGLSGLTESARDQIGCRLSLKHDDDKEIRETLMVSGQNSSDIISQAKNLKKGQGIYKRIRGAKEVSPDGLAYEYLKYFILYINDQIKEDIINKVIELTKGDYKPKEEIIVRGGGRIPITEKTRHPIQKYILDTYEPSYECIEWYPGAPATLEDAFCVEIENESAANILMVGENDELRDSMIIHSVCGFLMNSKNKVIVCVNDEEFGDRARMVEHLRNIHSNNLIIKVGVSEVCNEIIKLKKIRRNAEEKVIYIWYGLDKLKNEIFMLQQDEEPINENINNHQEDEELSIQQMINDLRNYLPQTNSSQINKETVNSQREDNKFDFEECKGILDKVFEMGPENNIYSFCIFNSFKTIKKSKILNPEYFDNRIGTKMSIDESYEIFKSPSATNKIDDNSALYYPGSGQTVIVRPYLLPSIEWYEEFNKKLNEL